MRYNTVLRYVGIVLLINALFLFISSIISAINGDQALFPLLYSSIIVGLFGIFPIIFVPASDYIKSNEGLLIVVSSWLISCVAGTLPYILWGGEFNFTNAWFESVSGFTTTGSSILTNVEILPMGLLFWRAATHWLGGIGIIIFVLAVVPSMRMAGLVLSHVELSPIVRDTFLYNTRKILRILLSVYVGLALLETIFLSIFGMNLFDAITHSFATIATGGFSTKNLSIAHYNSVPIEIVIIIFMILSGMHFGLLFSTLFERSKKIFKSIIVRYYVLAIVIGILITSFSLFKNPYKNWFEALRYAAFQITSIGTSTGFANTDSSIWPSLAQMLVIFFALQCACAGSTSGGIKADRIVMFWKAFTKQLKLLRHPNAVISVRIDDRIITDDILAMGVLYVCVYLGLVFIATVLLVVLGVDMLSAFSGVVATTGNVGPGLGTVGSMGNFSQIPSLGKWILTGTMLLGRLEIYGLVILFLPQFWKSN